MEIAEKFLKERGMERQWNDIEITFQGMVNLLNDFATYKVNELNKSDVIKSVCVCGAEHSNEAKYIGQCNYCLKQIS